MPRPKTIGRCATKGCKGRWQLTPRNQRQLYCPTCAGARKRVRDRAQAKHQRFIHKRKAFDRAEVVHVLACEYEASGGLDVYQHGDGEYTAREWAAIVAEAKALGESLILDVDYQAAMAELAAQDAAEDAARKAEQLAALKEALAVVTEKGDARGARVVRERIAALTEA
jgi:hypothetical protein